MICALILFAAQSSVFGFSLSNNRLGDTSRRHRARTLPYYVQATPYDTDASPPSYTMHNVDGIECREVSIDIESIGLVTILEATAKSQEDLVNAALALEDDEEMDGGALDVQLDAGDPYGSVLWPAASAVANHLMKFEQTDRKEQTLLELGTGTGLVAIAASRAGYQHVIATDYESVPLRLLEYSAAKLNGDVDLTASISTERLDICDYYDTPLPDADLVVAADIMYEPATGRAMAHRTAEALKRGSRVIIGCSPGRPGRPAFLDELKRIVPGIDAEFKDAEGTNCSGPRHDLICGEGSASVSDEPQMLLVPLMDLDPSCMPFDTN